MDYYDKFKALSDPIRLDILNALNNMELSQGILQINLLYRIQGFVSFSDTKKQIWIWKENIKNFIFYSLNLNGIQEISAVV